MNRKWDVGSKEMRKKCADEVLARIKEQEGAELGIVAAEDIINIVAQNIGPEIYNWAVRDCAKTVQDKTADLEIELSLLEQKD